MQTITKNQVSSYLMLEMLNRKRNFEQLIENFQVKHGVTFKEFEQRMHNSTTENFSDWDDYLEWKAGHEFLADTLTAIADIRNGDFKVV
jgi:hypothetical protein